MSLERIFQALVSLGLSESDARVYMYLALNGPKKTGKIVYNLKISKQQIVRSLENLQNKGIIVSDSESKNSFSALPFEEVLKSLIRKERDQTEMMLQTLLSTWKSMIEKN